MEPTFVARTKAVHLLGVALAIVGACHNALGLDFPGPKPGGAAATLGDDVLRMENGVLSMTWQFSGGSLRPKSVEDKISGKSIDLAGAECFELALANTPMPGTRTIRASELKIVGSPKIGQIAADPKAVRLADRYAGRTISATLLGDSPLVVTWTAVLRDGSNYIRQLVSCEAKQNDLELAEAAVWNLAAPDATVQGVVDGSPVTAGTFFFAAEHPTSKSTMLAGAEPSRFKCAYAVNKSLRPSEPLQFRSIVGVVPEGQLRRGFLYYLERERAQPYRQYLHYNNGSEIGCEYWSRKVFGKPGEAEEFRRREAQIWLSAIETFGRELVTNRHVALDGFAHDWGWDDENLVWQFHEGYPDGFKPIQEAAAKFGSRVGVWFSPFGGYTCQEHRLKAGLKQGFETYRAGSTLGGPRYFARFLAACQGMVDQYGVSYFKFDGFGASNNQPGALDTISDVEGLLDLIVRLRSKTPDLLINTSTGSWPSPFWLLYSDAIWRQGPDTEMRGEGSPRQKWVTYRDGMILEGTLDRGPLVPANSLMIHGIFINHLPFSGNPLDPKTPRPDYNAREITDEIRSFFATGVNMQEMYIATDLMTPRMWDVLAEAANWARRNAGVLVDTHHIGGNPIKGEVCGWASWTPKKAVLTLRNPSPTAATFSLDVAKAFELPAGAALKYVLKSPWSDDASKPAVEVQAGKAHTVTLQPFETLVFDATPVE